MTYYNAQHACLKWYVQFYTDVWEKNKTALLLRLMLVSFF